MKIAGRKVMMLRAKYDLMLLGSKSQKAIFFPDPKLKHLEMVGEVTESEAAVFISLKRDGRTEEHIVPLDSIETLRFFPEEVVAKSSKVKSLAV